MTQHSRSHTHIARLALPPERYSFAVGTAPLGPIVSAAVLGATGLTATEIQPRLQRASSAHPLDRVLVTVNSLPVDGRIQCEVRVEREVTLLGVAVLAALFVSIVGWFALLFLLIALEPRDRRRREEMVHGIWTRLADALGPAQPAGYADALDAVPAGV